MATSISKVDAERMRAMGMPAIMEMERTAVEALQVMLGTWLADGGDIMVVTQELGALVERLKARQADANKLDDGYDRVKRTSMAQLIIDAAQDVAVESCEQTLT